MTVTISPHVALPAGKRDISECSCAWISSSGAWLVFCEASDLIWMEIKLFQPGEALGDLIVVAQWARRLRRRWNQARYQGVCQEKSKSRLKHSELYLDVRKICSSEEDGALGWDFGKLRVFLWGSQAWLNTRPWAAWSEFSVDFGLSWKMSLDWFPVCSLHLQLLCTSELQR